MKKRPNSQSAFFYPRVLIGALLCFISVTLALFALRSASAQKINGPSSKESDIAAQYRGVAPVVHFDVSKPLREIKPVDPTFTTRREEDEEREVVPIRWRFVPEPDGALQKSYPLTPLIPNPLVSFNAQSGTASPPDPNMAVGPNNVIGIANSLFQIFTKGGTSVFGPAANNTLWAGFGGSCQTRNDGDPVVVYDQLADRWMIMQFTSAAPYLLCVAVSQTADPAGSYYRWSISTGNNFPDYPKASMWPDAYYFSTREFAGGTAFAGVGAYALNRAQALAGDPAAQVLSFLAAPTGGGANVGDGLLPADLDGTTLPPAGSPAFFVGSMDNNGPNGAAQDALTLWKFVANFTTPPASSFTLTNTVPVAPFNSILALCGGGRACIPQPGGATRLDHQGYRQRPLFRLAYRNFGTHESLVTNQSVSAGNGPSGEVSGIRWWEMRSPNSSPIIFQEGTYAPGLTDGIHRWMGSIAMNAAGDMALGYSASSPSVFPSIYYTGRNAGSALGQMTLGEAAIYNGTASAAPLGNRWGDYTAIDVDPVDDATFWYMSEYYPSASTTWTLRVGSFTLSTVPVNSFLSGGAAIIAAGPNNTLDPGETVTVALGIRDVNAGAPGSICTSAALTGTLQPGGGVTSPSGPQNYGSICTDTSTVFRQFTFTVDPSLPCGSTVTASLAIVDGVTNYGTITYQFVTGSTGATTVSPLENFDGVTAPALPAGWTTAFTGAGAAVVTSTTFPDTAPNTTFFVDSTTTGLSELTSPTIAIPSGAARRLSFRNLFNTESPWDGMVLEISINGGAFQDIIAAGGSFVSGGYSGGLNASANPLTGRQAWFGLSAGSAAAPAYINSVVNLPAAAAGQNVQFKWRLGSDASVAPTTNPGARIDTISLATVPPLVCSGSAPTATSAVSRKTHPGAGTFDIPLFPNTPLTGAIPTEPRTEATAGTHQIVVNFGSPVTVSSASVSTGTGTAALSVVGSTVTVNLTGVTDVQRLGVTLKDVNDGVNLGSVIIPMGILAGDTNGSGGVNASDTGQTKVQSGNAADAGNFRTDVNVSGSITGSDISLVKSRSGANLP